MFKEEVVVIINCGVGTIDNSNDDSNAVATTTNIKLKLSMRTALSYT